MPVTTLRALCEQHAPDAIDFLKIDVEGAEREVLDGDDWRALPAQGHRRRGAGAGHDGAVLGRLGTAADRRNGYRFAFSDGLNRYYVAEEHTPDAWNALERRSRRRSKASSPFGAVQAGARRRPHPDHGLARLLAGADMVRLPLLSLDAIAERLINGLDPAELDRPAQPVRYRRCPPAAVRHTRSAALGRTPPARPQRDNPRSLSQCGRHRSVPGRLRPHLGKLGLVTDPVASGI